MRVMRSATIARIAAACCSSMEVPPDFYRVGAVRSRARPAGRGPHAGDAGSGRFGRPCKGIGNAGGKSVAGQLATSRRAREGGRPRLRLKGLPNVHGRRMDADKNLVRTDSRWLEIPELERLRPTVAALNDRLHLIPPEVPSWDRFGPTVRSHSQRDRRPAPGVGQRSEPRPRAVFSRGRRGGSAPSHRAQDGHRTASSAPAGSVQRDCARGGDAQGAGRSATPRRAPGHRRRVEWHPALGQAAGWGTDRCEVARAPSAVTGRPPGCAAETSPRWPPDRPPVA